MRIVFSAIALLNRRRIFDGYYPMMTVNNRVHGGVKQLTGGRRGER
jgi:hypothetical protein